MPVHLVTPPARPRVAPPARPLGSNPVHVSVSAVHGDTHKTPAVAPAHAVSKAKTH